MLITIGCHMWHLLNVCELSLFTQVYAMKNLLKLLRFLLICLPGFSLFPLHAQDTFGSGVNEFTIDFVEVGDAGNPDDSGTTGLYHSTSGGVAYVYRMGTYEISRDMITKANALGNLNITMSNFGSSASDRPAGGIIWNEAARFVNWLNTSKGYPVAYKFATQPGDVGYSANENVEIWTSSDAGYDADNPYRNANALYVLPSEDEWYKAAYYSGTGNVYNDYAVGDDTIPAGVSGGVDSGSAVYVQGATSGPAAITNAGGLSDYGVMGMNGNVWEWTEITSDDVAFRGGHWYSQEANLRSSQRIVSAVGGGDDASRGFRVASRTPLVLPADQTLTFAAIADQTTTDTVTLAATASSGLPVSYAVTGPASLSGSNLSFTGAGTVQVTASQAGDDDWNAAPAVVRSFEVTKAVAQVYFEDLYQIYDGNPKSVTAYTEPWGLTLEITYDSSSTSPSAAGSYAVVATIVDDTYQGSETETFQILPLVEGSDVLESVLVGNPGNSNDSTGFGAVSYEYYISTYEVTNAQYAAFLNAVAETDTYSLYTSWDLLYGGIARSGSDGSYSYATTRPNAPVNYITFWAAARYVNWLTNGRPTGPQGPGTTETGMYNLGGVDFPVNNTVTRDATAWANGGVAIANENEWYKAAYYDPGLNSGAGGYWLYPTQSNTLPTAAAPNASDANSANHDNFVGNVTDVGGYTLAASAYGTYNQAGNVEEWIEDIDVSGNARIFRGGRFSYANGLDATSASYATPETYGPVLGFRVTSLRPLSDVPGLVVTTLADTIDAGDGQTSLREAIAYAATLSGAQTITFSDNTDDGAVDFHDGTARTITLGGTQLTLSSDLNIEGPGASLLSVSADNSSRVFQVDTDTEVTFTGFTVRDGEVAEDGGGILNGGDLTLLEMIITENESTVYFNGAGVYNLTGATLTIRRSLFSDNSATSDGGGFFNNNGTVLVENSTFSGNHAGGFGGAFVTSGDLGVVDVTVVYSTFTGNNSDVGPGGFHAPASGTVNITASIVAGNTGSGPNDVDVNGGAQSGGHNLIGVQGNSSGWVATDQVGSQSTPLDPVLGPLQDNGGPTSTHALLAGSPALFAAAAVEGVTTDQRGVARPQAIAADVGAYEAEPTVTVTLSNLTQTFDGNPKSATVVTDPVGVNVEVTYDGSSTAPTSSGSYSVRAIVDEPGQIGGVIGTLAISKGSQAITFSAIADQSTADTVTLAATASSGLPVSYAVTGPATLSGSNLSFTGAGTVQVTASQAGSGNWDAASAVVRSFEVSKAVATVTLSGLNQSFDGSAKSVTATTDPAGLTVGITYDGSSTAPSSAGSYAVVATINDTLYQGSASGTLEISSANQSITFAAIADQTTTDTVTLAATASSGLPVSYAVTGPASLSGSDLTFTGAGTVQVTASQAGNDDWDAASAVQRSFEVSKAVATVTLSGLNQSFDGTAKSVTATTDPTGLTVDITYDGSSTAPSAAGSYAVVATINDTLYQGSASGTLEISSANQSITFAAIADQTTTDTVTLAATASSGLPVSYAVTGPASLSGSDLTFTGAGTVQVTASQAGDDDWDAASAVARSFEVSKAVATVTLNGLNQSFDGSAKSVTATTVPAGLTVDITYDGSSIAPSAAGSYAVVATINDTLYQGSASGSLEISTANQSITFAAIADQSTTATVTLAATASSGLPVSYAVTGPASLSGSDLTFSGAGTVQVTASQAGNTNWNAATPVVRSFEVTVVNAEITGLSPNRANIGGGIEVVISGNNLGDGSDITGVLLAGVSATILTQTSDSVTVFVNAAETAGVGDVKVTSTSKGEVTLVDGFEYLWLASPEQLEPTDITASSLVAHWTLVPGADTHVLDVGTDQNFDTYVTGFEKLDVAQTTQQVIPDLSAGAWYAIRVFASNAQGLSLPSRTVWVPAGDNIPYVLNPPPSGPVSLGSVLTFNPIYMFHGSGMVYSTISSAPTVVDASINEEGLLRLEMLQPGTAMITVTATDPVTHYSSSYTFNVEVLNAMPVVESNTFAERESWNIRFTQKVSLRNNSGADALGVRVLFSDLAPGITIENQTGASEDGRPVLEVSTAFADGEALSFNIVYLATTVSPEVQPPTLAFEYILKDFVPPLPGEGVEVTRIQPIGDGTDRIVIEFETQPGALYAVEYMNDFPDGDWVEVPLRLRAGANKTQWIDSGPPVTQPSSGMRVYRVKQLIEGEE